MEENEVEPPALALTLPDDLFGGVWSNFAIVSHSPYEFTIDFVRVDYNQGKGIVTSRVNLSPLFVTQLLETLQTNWDQYAQKAMPQDLQDGR